MTLPTPPEHTIHWLQRGTQRLGLLPTLGGSVAAWEHANAQGSLPIWRPWAGVPDLYTTASFPLVPWSNRIAQGGFEHAGRQFPMAPNRAGEAYPIHGDGWLQPWTLQSTSPHSAEMALESRHFGGNPHHYRAVQRFDLHDDGMDQYLGVTHLGTEPLPYGLGQHPAFVKSPACRLRAQVEGVWLCGADPIPTRHTADFPPGWDLREGMHLQGDDLIDNAYTGWNGSASMDWPEHGFRLDMEVAPLTATERQAQYCLLYRPPEGAHFCFEPVTHPIDAFHMPGAPGLQVLATGETLSLKVRWRFSTLV